MLIIGIWRIILKVLRSLFSNLVQFTVKETYRCGIVFLKEILTILRKRVEIVGFGGDDFSHDIGVSRSPGDEELDFARKQFALTCLAFKLIPVDSPYVKFTDKEGLKKELIYLKKIGFKAKFAIHPSQIDIINENFDIHYRKDLKKTI